jgi:hypothetical protein
MSAYHSTLLQRELLFSSQDGHAQERSRFNEVLAVVKPNQIWIGDRNFCTAEFLTTIAGRSAYFVMRQHCSLGWKELSELKATVQTDTGDIFEQKVETCYQVKPLKCRQAVVKLFGEVHGAKAEEKLEFHQNELPRKILPEN